MKVVYITKLYLENFRCYDKFEIDFDKELTVIVAENGQGKTAILDAVAIAMGPYLSCFRTVRRVIFTKRTCARPWKRQAKASWKFCV